MTRIFLFLFLILICIKQLTAQTEEFTRTTFSSQHGIPPLKISQLAIDSSGYLWLASNIGLHTFDGSEFRTFTSLPNTHIGDIQIMSDGTPLVGLSNEGLAIYDSKKDDFEILELEEVFKASNGRNFNIVISEDQKVYLSHNGSGLFEFHPETQTVTLLLKKLYIDQIALHPSDKSKMVLMADSLYSIDLNTKKIALISSNSSFDIVFDKDDNLWYTSFQYDGLFRFNWETKVEEFFPYNLKQKPTFLGLVYRQNSLWMASDNGLLEFEIEEKIWKEHFGRDGYTSGIYNDNRDRLWFGQNNLLHVLDPQNQHFTLVPNTMGVSYASMAHISDDKYLFAPFQGSGLEIYDVSENSLSPMELEGDLKSLVYPFSMVKIGKEIYILYGNGIAKFACEKLSLEKIEFNQYNDFFLKNYKKKGYTDKNGTFWMAAFNDNSIFKVDTKTLAIDSIRYKIPKVEYTQDVSITDEGLIFLKSEWGLYQINFESKSMLFLPFIFKGDSLNLGYLDGLSIDQSEVWILARGSTFMAEMKEDRIEIIKELNQEGTFNYNVGLDIQKLSDEEVVILTSAGIKIYSRSADEYTFFGMEDGLVNADQRLRLKIFGNRMFFLSDGIVHVKKTEIEKINFEPKLSINLFEVDGKNLIDSTEIELRQVENDIKIQFKSIDLTKPLDVKYKYRISSDDDWIYADHDDNEIFLLDLKSGDYNFEVAAKHRYSNWSVPVKVEFKIKKPFWKTLGFVLLSIGTILLLVYFIYKRQLARSNVISTMKTRMAELENEALRAQMNPHFIFNSLNSIKSYIIEHEKEEAADYLTDFSDLIRLILSNSREQLIPIDREMEALKLYMDIENIRLENKFTYTINNEVGDCLIQPLTLQPFIENAIWHGFIHKVGIGNLKIDIKRNGENVVIAIEDDGVGRKKSQEIEKKHDRKRSFGILITKERLAQNLDGEQIKIIDIENEGGTLVQIKIPFVTTKPAIA